MLALSSRRPACRSEHKKRRHRHPGCAISSSGAVAYLGQGDDDGSNDEVCLRAREPLECKDLLQALSRGQVQQGRRCQNGNIHCAVGEQPATVPECSFCHIVKGPCTGHPLPQPREQDARERDRQPHAHKHCRHTGSVSQQCTDKV